MLVCLCSGVRDREIRDAVREGAANRQQVAQACRGAGQGCGTCLPRIDQLIREETLAAAQERATEVVEGGVLAAG